MIRKEEREMTRRNEEEGVEGYFGGNGNGDSFGLDDLVSCRNLFDKVHHVAPAVATALSYKI